MDINKDVDIDINIYGAAASRAAALVGLAAQGCYIHMFIYKYVYSFTPD